MNELYEKLIEYQKLFSSKDISSEYLILVILKNDKDFSKTLNKFNLTYDAFFAEVKRFSFKSETINIGKLSLLVKKIINKSKNNLSSLNIFLNLLQEGEGVGIRLMINLNINIDSLYNFLLRKINNYDFGVNLKTLCNINEKLVGYDDKIFLLSNYILKNKVIFLVSDDKTLPEKFLLELSRRIVFLGFLPEVYDKDIIKVNKVCFPLNKILFYDDISLIRNKNIYKNNIVIIRSTKTQYNNIYIRGSKIIFLEKVSNDDFINSIKTLYDSKNVYISKDSYRLILNSVNFDTQKFYKITNLLIENNKFKNVYEKENELKKLLINKYKDFENGKINNYLNKSKIESDLNKSIKLLKSTLKIKISPHQIYKFLKNNL